MCYYDLNYNDGNDTNSHYLETFWYNEYLGNYVEENKIKDIIYLNKNVTRKNMNWITGPVRQHQVQC